MVLGHPKGPNGLEMDSNIPLAPRKSIWDGMGPYGGPDQQIWENPHISSYSTQSGKLQFTTFYLILTQKPKKKNFVTKNSSDS